MSAREKIIEAIKKIDVSVFEGYDASKGAWSYAHGGIPFEKIADAILSPAVVEEIVREHIGALDSQGRSHFLTKLHGDGLPK